MYLCLSLSVCPSFGLNISPSISVFMSACFIL
jgi:hypothetical protein